MSFLFSAGKKKTKKKTKRVNCFAGRSKKIRVVMLINQ